ncbi:c-type cytochrome [Methylocystis parvus]
MTRRLVAMITLIGLSACSDMSVQQKQKAYRPLVAPVSSPAGVVAFRSRPETAPAVTLALLERGKERYGIFCAPCHDEAGDGRGMIVQRGFPAPPSYHTQRLRDTPPKRFYDVITDGFGAMYSYASRVPPEDRWAIAAYIKALQQSRANAQATSKGDGK